MKPFSGLTKNGLFMTKNEPFWRFSEVDSSMINNKFHMRITCPEEPAKRIQSDTVNFVPFEIDKEWRGLVRYYITESNMKYCLNANNTLKLKFMVKFLYMLNFLKKKTLNFPFII
jgi:hypothetical protein